MKAAEMREKSVEDLQAELIKLRKDQFGQRMQKASGQLGQSHLLRSTRREIARIKTILQQRVDAAAS